MKMMIVEKPAVVEFLERRGLLKQYKKAKNYLVQGHYINVNFKLRQPKEAGIYAFRINKQFRALAVFKGGSLLVFEIDSHQ